ncbi:hypothetical protein THICB1_20002 [Thiomonas arsenitoxydans]|uniref:Transposase n=1 Tax=Thiomonas arsenitoxydans (strain DSM 22701 / CIP 110005 / 3As) TaxID=426114 RepID=A0ABM9T6C6_THIA3|nr:hypothetical protein THICB6_120180 [Thiomonas arsenitoxydans]CQR31851.1 hypothetical protein THICB1_20002 [Thiomonas arsenitoxydans]CQR34898.1 hypothetical protein ACO7_420018 [Thiomonas arsenitoxydans]CQR34964.1 hypothetical protein ACO3_420025 [Thiomonas arsenitoxydans]CQR44526.1 hypothetical protein THICB3520023 [Thiomonas sp. CB3]
MEGAAWALTDAGSIPQMGIEPGPLPARLMAQQWPTVCRENRRNAPKLACQALLFTGIRRDPQLAETSVSRSFNAVWDRLPPHHH